MASLTQIGKALKERRFTWCLASAIIRHGSGSRNSRDVNSTAKLICSDLIGSGSSCGGNVMELNSSSHHMRFLPGVKHDETKSCKQLNELTSVVNPTEKVDQALLYGRRRKRSSETIRHDKLYLQTKDLSKREYVQTWNDFEDKRSIPTTEWGKRLSEE